MLSKIKSKRGKFNVNNKTACLSARVSLIFKQSRTMDERHHSERTDKNEDIIIENVTIERSDEVPDMKYD